MNVNTLSVIALQKSGNENINTMKHSSGHKDVFHMSERAGNLAGTEPMGTLSPYRVSRMERRRGGKIKHLKITVLRTSRKSDFWTYL